MLVMKKSTSQIRLDESYNRDEFVQVSTDLGATFD